MYIQSVQILKMGSSN